MLRTVATRLTGTKAEIEAASADGLDVADAINNSSKYRQDILLETGGLVDIMEEDGKTYKSTFEILKELSQVWNNLSSTAQAVIISDAAGKRCA